MCCSMNLTASDATSNFLFLRLHVKLSVVGNADLNFTFLAQSSCFAVVMVFLLSAGSLVMSEKRERLHPFHTAPPFSLGTLRIVSLAVECRSRLISDTSRRLILIRKRSGRADFHYQCHHRDPLLGSSVCMLSWWCPTWVLSFTPISLTSLWRLLFSKSSKKTAPQCVCALTVQLAVVRQLLSSVLYVGYLSIVSVTRSCIAFTAFFNSTVVPLIVAMSEATAWSAALILLLWVGFPYGPSA